MYLMLKLLHVASVVAFLGNITIGVFWHALAKRTRDPKVLAFTMDGIIQADRWVTNPGAIGIVVAGVAMALLGPYSLLRTDWILGGIVLISVSGGIYGMRLVPLQRKLRDLAAEGARSGAFDFARYEVLARQWELWGAISLATPILALVLMVLKPGR